MVEAKRGVLELGEHVNESSLKINCGRVNLLYYLLLKIEAIKNISKLSLHFCNFLAALEYKVHIFLGSFPSNLAISTFVSPLFLK